MKRIAVTGGAGFIGSNLVRALIREDFEVLVIDNFSTGLKSNLNGLDCETTEVSLTDSVGLSRALKKSEYIFHLGARGSVPRSIKNPRATMEENVMGTLNVLEIAKETGAVVAFSSSSSVYGANLQIPKSEKMWMSPLTPYAASKLSCEALVTAYTESFDIPAITYRLFNVYGPWQRPDHDYSAVVPKWIWKLMSNKTIEVFGDGRQSRDFTYVDTVVSVLIQGLKGRTTTSNPVNLAFGTQITLNQCIDNLRLKFPSLDIRYLPERQGDVRNSQNDPSLIKSMFPMITPVDFSQGLDKTCEWFFEHGSSIANGPLVKD